MHFDFVDLKLFVSLANTKNLTRAAERTSLSLSVASARIKNLEESLDYEFVAVPGTRWVDTFLSGSDSGTAQRMQIRVLGPSYESVCRMVGADVGISVMLESAANRNAQSAAIKIIKRSNDWAASSLQICARSFDQLPIFSRELVDMMANDFRHATRPNLQLA